MHTKSAKLQNWLQSHWSLYMQLRAHYLTCNYANLSKAGICAAEFQFLELRINIYKDSRGEEDLEEGYDD